MNLNTVYLGLGSNINRQVNLNSCLNVFKSSFRKISISPIYESKSFGFNGNDFYNLVVKIETAFTISQLKHWIMSIEDQHGRDRSQPRYSNRTLDIDILLFNDWIGEFKGSKVPRKEILNQAYVLKPLADLAPHLKHPVTQLSFQQHWNQLKSSTNQKITRLSL